MIILPVLLLTLVAATDPVSDPPLELSLDDAILFAVGNNLSIQGAKLDASAALQGFNSAWGAFDAIYYVNASTNSSRRPPGPPSVFGGLVSPGSPATSTEGTTLSTGFTGMLMTGTQWTFDLTLSKFDSETVKGTPALAAFKTRNLTGAWKIELTQPLLRGGADDYPITGLQLARHDAHSAMLSAEEVANATLRSVITAYWNLVFARQDLGTRELSVTLASELLDITRRKFDQGLQNRINVTEVEAELAQRREELLTARNTEEAAEDELRKLLLAPDENAEWERELLPTTVPEPPRAETLDLDEAIRMGLMYRPDVAQARVAMERADVEVRRAKNEARSRLDLTGAYQQDSNQPTWGTALDKLDNDRYRGATFSLAYELPLGNRTAGYTYRRLQTQRQRAGVTLRETQMNAVGELRIAVREVELQIARVAATAETTRLNSEVYEGEKRRLENDLSTPFQVRQTQRDLLTAIDAETRAQLDLEVARASLLAAQGRLLYAYGLERSAPEMSLDDAPPRP
ncbi:MAG: TolC family protein [Planctomycetota bacterium]|jgi:outer membrane protein TolC